VLCDVWGVLCDVWGVSVCCVMCGVCCVMCWERTCGVLCGVWCVQMCWFVLYLSPCVCVVIYMYCIIVLLCWIDPHIVYCLF